ncbi:mitochondrial ribosomal protein subunit L20-domain-containing protein [Lipomyces kononenkoae]|uniref:Mitochondrial ribosomal protein subunit L20-domain-containing protein n=1 Tax=Lipomyces kononenkoae TaxID=34357 RepID=A0ACC3SXJ5_LIPKO
MGILRTSSPICSILQTFRSNVPTFRSTTIFSTSDVRHTSSGSAKVTRLKDPKKFRVPYPTKYNPISSANKAVPILPPGLSYNPPPTAPSPFETPDIFLPPSERRLVSTAEALPVLPPALRETKKKTYHLTQEQIEEIKQLRTAQPYKWTRKSLAKKYGCSQFFVGMIAEAPESRKLDMQRRLAVIKSRWGLFKRTARTHRQKRRELWAKGE